MIYNKLYQYQKRIVDNQINPSSALFMDMGTGKTITSLALFEKSNKKKLLIICLVSKIFDWRDEVIQNFGDITNIALLNKGTAKNIEILEDKSIEVIICNYESIWRLDKHIINFINEEWFVIVDESHKIKNTKSKIGKFTRKLSVKTKSKCILTGTPQNHGYLDYYNQLSFIDVFKMSEKEFRRDYCIFQLKEMNGKYFTELVGYKNYKELDEHINRNCVFFKRDIKDEMIPTEVNTKIQKHKSIDKFKRTRVHGDIIAENSSVLRMYLRQLCSGFISQEKVSNNKIEWLEDFLDSYEDRVVVFVNFNMEVEDVKQLCIKMKRPYSIYNGAYKDLTKFKENSNAVAICNYASAAMGINDLVLSNVCVMYSPTEDYILFSQSKKRIDRIGQTKKPLYYYLQTDKSVEVAIYKSLSNGQNFDDRLFDKYMSENE